MSCADVRPARPQTLVRSFPSALVTASTPWAGGRMFTRLRTVSLAAALLVAGSLTGTAPAAATARPAHLVLWSTLDNAHASLVPVVGPAGTLSDGGGSYVAGRFGLAYH